MNGLRLGVLVCVVMMAMLGAQGRPRYVAIPLEDLEEFLVEESRHHPQVMLMRRAGRAADRGQADAPVYNAHASPYYADQSQYEAAPSDRFERGAGHYGGGDYVDYGAYTGSKGAFGWYTDHPVGYH